MLKFACSLATFLLILMPVVLPCTAQAQRETTVLNAEWSYHAGDLPGIENLGDDPASWEPVHVPHGFQQPYWMDRVHFGGIGWYQKTLHLDTDLQGQRIHLEFEGAFQHTHVYVNGQLVGEHRGGFTGFTFDITDYVNFGGENTLAVRVSAEWDEQIAPRTGDFSFIGGLYRDVYLVTTHPVHVPWYGTFVTTPFGGPLTDTTYSLPTHYDQAPVLAQTEIHNSSDTDQSVRVRTQVINAEGETVASDEQAREVSADTVVEFAQRMTLDNPEFWSPDHPYLYTVLTTVFVGDEPVDTYETPLGVRWFQATAREGFWLNGQRLWLRGFNVHQDHAGWGWAVTNSGFYRDMRLMRDAGANLIRGSHYPKDPSLLDACDRFGMLMIQELAFWGRGGGGGPPATPNRNSEDFAPFVENVEQQLAAMIRISRNNPSVFVWSLTNEPTGAQLPTTPLHRLARELDPSRPTMRVTNFSNGEADIYGRNGYNPEQANAPVMFTELWEREELRPGNFPSRPDPESPHSMGTARWAGFDYGTHHDWNLNLVGICDNARLPKRRWHWHRAAWLGIDPPAAWPEEGTPAALSIQAEKTTLGTNGQDDTQLIVHVLDAQGQPISNVIDVTLAVVSGPGQFPTGDTLTLSTPDGVAGISFRAYEPGQTVLSVTAAGLEPATIELEFVAGGIHTQPQPEPWPEVATVDLPDLPDLAHNRPATASSQQANNPARNAVDQNIGSRWCAEDGQLNHWWQVDLGQEHALAGVGIIFEQYAPYQYLIEVSSDGQSWTTASDQSQSSSINRRQVVNFQATARYVRIRYTALPDGIWASHSEFRVYPEQAVALQAD